MKPKSDEEEREFQAFKREEIEAEERKNALALDYGKDATDTEEVEIQDDN